MSDQLSLLISSSADSPAKTSQWREIVADWLESDPDSSGSSVASLASALPRGFFSKTSLAFCRQTEGETWAPSSGRWGNSGMASPGACLTLNTSEFHNDAVASSLSDIVEVHDVPAKYSLSPKACAGILRRAEKRGRVLPEALARALECSAQSRTP